MPGLYTDDTQQALALSDVLIGRGSADAEPAWPSSTWRWPTPRGSTSGPTAASAGASARCWATWSGASPRPDRAATRPASAPPCGSRRSALYFDDDAEGAVRRRDGRQPDDPPGHPQPGRGAWPWPAPCGGWWPATDPRAELPVPAGRRRRRGPRTGSPPSTPAVVASVEPHGRASRGHRPRSSARWTCPATAPRRPGRGGQPPRRRARLPRPTMGFPPACIPTCLYLLLTTETLRGGGRRGRQPRRRRRHRRRDPRGLCGAHYGEPGHPERLLERLQNREGIDLRGAGRPAATRPYRASPTSSRRERPQPAGRSLWRDPGPAQAATWGPTGGVDPGPRDLLPSDRDSGRSLSFAASLSGTRIVG